MKINGQPWFVAADACRGAGLSIGGGVAQHLKSLDPDEKGMEVTPTPGGPQKMIVVSRPGLFKLIARSTKPEAKRFDRWVRYDETTIGLFDECPDV